MVYDPATKAALTGPVIHKFKVVEILHPYRTIRLLDGPGFLTVFGHVFVGRDQDIGVLGPISISDDGPDNEAASASVGINPINDAVGVELLKPLSQGALVSIWTGAFSPVTGQVVGTPYCNFTGEIDQPHVGLKSGAVSFDCVSGTERFFDVDEGMLLAHGFQTSIWTDDMGLEFVVDVALSMPHGAPGARPELTRAR